MDDVGYDGFERRPGRPSPRDDAKEGTSDWPWASTWTGLNHDTWLESPCLKRDDEGGHMCIRMVMIWLDDGCLCHVDGVAGFS